MIQEQRNRVAVVSGGSSGIGLATVRQLLTCGHRVAFFGHTLLRQSSPHAELMLSNISAEFVELLKQLRSRDIRFGFVSDNRGMDAGSYGQAEFEALTHLLDKLLGIRGAMPDFWMASRRIGQTSEIKIRSPGGLRQSYYADMILRATKWYGAEKTEPLFVGRFDEGLLSENDASIIGVRYIALRRD